MEQVADAIRRTIGLPHHDAVAATRAALANRGLGVMPRIDVRAKMKANLDRDMPPHLIIGACATSLL